MTRTFLPVLTGIVLLVPEAYDITPHAHITLLAPFGAGQQPSSGELDEVAAYFAGVTPFTYSLTDVSTFPDGTRYLSPDPAARFSRMTHSLHRAFPEYPPYHGKFDLVVPHLTVEDDAVVPALPIQAHAREATLLHYDGDYTELATFPFGADAA